MLPVIEAIPSIAILSIEEFPNVTLSIKDTGPLATRVLFPMGKGDPTLKVFIKLSAPEMWRAPLELMSVETFRVPVISVLTAPIFTL